jgi:hypothetical protein
MNDNASGIESYKPEGDSDWLLQHVVDLTNTGISVPVTLTTAGGLVTGATIHGAEYLDLFKLELTKNWPSDMQSTYSEVVEQWKADVYPQPSSTEQDSPERFASFIHLKDARLVNAGTVVPGNRGMLWRGRLSSVIGFTIGVLSPSSAGEE